MYIVYDDNGMIISTIVGPDATYGDKYLTPKNQKWTFLQGASNIDPTRDYIDVETKALLKAQPINLSVDKIEFNADNKDIAKITGIPIGANVVVFCNNVASETYIINDGELEFNSDTPATYQIQVTCHKYYPASLTITAIEPKPEPSPLPQVAITNKTGGMGNSFTVPDIKGLSK